VSLAPHVLVPEPLADLAPGTIVTLPDTTMHHLRRSLRRIDGSALSLTDGEGARAPAELTPAGARLTAAASVQHRRAPQFVLAQSLAKGRRADEAVRMACELGVDRIVPVIADRTQGRPDERAASAVVARWSAVAVAALEQSRRTHLTEVAACHTSAQLAELTSDVRLVAVPGALALPDVFRRSMPPQASGGRAPSGSTTGSTRGDVWVAVGPEGGFSDSEIDLLVGSGWLAVGLGASVLRTEHAGPIAIAVLAALSGHWREPIDEFVEESTDEVDHEPDRGRQAKDR